MTDDCMMMVICSDALAFDLENTSIISPTISTRSKNWMPRTSPDTVLYLTERSVSSVVPDRTQQPPPRIAPLPCNKIIALMTMYSATQRISRRGRKKMLCCCSLPTFPDTVSKRQNLPGHNPLHPPPATIHQQKYFWRTIDKRACTIAAKDQVVRYFHNLADNLDEVEEQDANNLHGHTTPETERPRPLHA